MMTLVTEPASRVAVSGDRAGDRPAVDGLRVCMVSFYFHPDYSGSSIQAFNLSRELLTYGIRPIIVSANLGGRPRRERYEDIVVHRLPVARRWGLQIPSFWAMLASFLVRHRREFDIVHAHGTLQHGTAALCGRALGKPTILKIAMAGSDIAFHRQGRLWGAFNRFMVSRFDRYVATTDVIAREIGQQLDGSRTVRIPNGVDTEKHSPLPVEARAVLRSRLGLPAGPLVAFVGIINGRKNVDGILRIWQRVVAARAPGHLVLVGPVPDDTPAARRFRSQIDEYVRANDLGGRVTFTGYRSDVVPYLQASDLFLFPSRQEGMPNVVLEAMACGLPALVSGSAGVESVIEHDVDGYSIDVNDEAGFARALVGLLASPRLRDNLGTAARRTAVEKFSLAAVARQYVSLYADIAGR